MLICTSHPCIPETLQRKKTNYMGDKISTRQPTAKPSTLHPCNQPAIKLESVILNNIPCFLLLSFQEKLASNTLDWKLVLETSGGSSIRAEGRDQAVRLWRCLKRRTGTRFPGGFDCLVNLMRSSSALIQRDLTMKGKGSGPRLHNPQPFIGPLLVGPKVGSGILTLFA